MDKIESVTSSDLMKKCREHPVSAEELKAENAKERREYMKKLRELCPSREMRQQARRIAKRETSCEQCVYAHDDSMFCYNPHTDSFMEELNVDPCYEGVLKYLVEQAEEAKSFEPEINDMVNSIFEGIQEAMEIIDQVDEYLCRATDFVDESAEVVYLLASYIIRMTDENWRVPPEILASIRSLYESRDTDLQK